MTDFPSWFDAGFRDLISVVPPGAPLSERTKLRLEDRGKVPGLFGRHGWYGFDWMKHETTRDDVDAWERAGANLGLRATHFPAVDIDVTDRDLRDIVHALADKHLGPAPQRTGRAPKLLLIYRLAEGQAPMVRRRLWFKGADGRQHLLEMLGHGQQYVVEGVHPITKRPYTWDSHPSEHGAARLTAITKAQIDAFFEDVAILLECEGCEVGQEEGSGSEVTDRTAIVQDELKAPSLEDLTDAVSLIPNTNALFPGRTDYIRMGCAIKAAGAADPDQALEVWRDWAGRWEGNEHFAANEPDQIDSDWERMKPPFEVGWGYVRDHAQAHGYAVAATEFDELPDAAAPAEDEAPPAPKTYAPVPRQLPGDFNPAVIERRPWVLGARFLRGAVTGGIGAPGVSKSTFSILSALAIVTGREDLTGEVVHVRGKAWIHNNEDPIDELERRIAGVCLRYGIAFAEVRPRLFYSSGAEQRLVVAGKDAAGTIRKTKQVDEIKAFLAANDIVFWACDPFVSTHDGVAENANEEVEKVIGVFREIAQHTACTIDLVHHSVKNHSGNSEARAGDMNAARGAGAFIGAVRVAYTLSAMSQDTADRLGIDETLAARLVRLDPAKGNYAAKSWTPEWFALESQPLGNAPGDFDDVEGDLQAEGDTVGVHVRFDLAAVTKDAETKAEAARETRKRTEEETDRRYLLEAFPEGGSLLSDYLPKLEKQWDLKKTQARERFLAALPPGQKFELDGWALWSHRIGKADNTPIEVHKCKA